MGPDEFARRWARGQQLIHENGVTYNVYGDPRGMERPWQLNPVPLVISSSEWAAIEQGVRQRAALLNAIVADVYGAMRIINEGHMPPSLLIAQPYFLRPLAGVSVPRDTWIHLVAFDIARSPDGRWWVVSDRTQAPSGMGYALENRLVSTRTLPEAFRDCQVQRLAEFFGHLSQAIASLAPARRENPRVVLLTPGPYNETYFEHAYLARYLGYTLVEAGDLTVRDGRVMLKSLSGLLPVDVILRRTDDSYCDPLELREDSMLGIAGLVGAVRQGHVAVANALGSGIAQMPGLAAFLPGICRALLGEELMLPSVATWWCGQPGPLEAVIANLDRLVIKPADPTSTQPPVFTDRLSPSQRESLVRQIRRQPRDYIAQEQVHLSTAPSWDEGRVVPRHVMVRVFAVARPDGSWSVMPGGLTRVSGGAGSTLVSMQKGGGSKDTWVLSDSPVSAASPLRPPGAPVELTRAGFVLPSRVADNLFWLGRYVERVEFSLRVARTALRALSVDLELASLPELIDVMTRQPASSPVGHSRSDPRPPEPPAVVARATESRLLDLLFETRPAPGAPRSVRSDIEDIQRIASSVRDRLSADAWRTLTRLDDAFARPAVSPSLVVSHTLDLLDQNMITLSAFTGQTFDGMTRDKSWRFLEVGRCLERAIHLADLLRWCFARADAGESSRLEATLDIANSSMTYRSRYLTTLQAPPVLDLLLLDETNPRSMAWLLSDLLSHAEFFPIDPATAVRSADQKLLLQLITDVRLVDVHAVLAEPTRADLHRLLLRLGRQLPEVSDAVTRIYLSHVRLPRTLST